MNDLVALVADGTMGAGLRGLLARSDALRIRPPTHEILVHPRRDPGCVRNAHDVLRPFCRRYAHALVMFDRKGCGQEQRSREELETRVEQNLAACGWDDRAAAIVLDPELEAWVWADSPHVEAALGWLNRPVRLKRWMTDRGLLRAHQHKPAQPKQALRTVLREVHMVGSSAIYLELARTVSLERCTDPAFNRLLSIMRNWFRIEGTP